MVENSSDLRESGPNSACVSLRTVSTSARHGPRAVPRPAHERAEPTEAATCARRNDARRSGSRQDPDRRAHRSSCPCTRGSQPCGRPRRRRAAAMRSRDHCRAQGRGWSPWLKYPARSVSAPPLPCASTAAAENSREPLSHQPNQGSSLVAYTGRQSISRRTASPTTSKTALYSTPNSLSFALPRCSRSSPLRPCRSVGSVES